MLIVSTAVLGGLNHFLKLFSGFLGENSLNGGDNGLIDGFHFVEFLLVMLCFLLNSDQLVKQEGMVLLVRLFGSM